MHLEKDSQAESDTRKQREVIFYGSLCAGVYVCGNNVYAAAMSRVQTTGEPGERKVNSLQKCLL